MTVLIIPKCAHPCYHIV